jgi:hypothetical protein
MRRYPLTNGTTTADIPAPEPQTHKPVTALRIQVVLVHDTQAMDARLHWVGDPIPRDSTAGVMLAAACAIAAGALGGSLGRDCPEMTADLPPWLPETPTEPTGGAEG